MIEQADSEQRILEAKLSSAIEEAWERANEALVEATKRNEGFEKKIRAAAEAAEYTSLIFSLTHGLEDVDPPVSKKKGQSPVSLLKDSVDALKRLRQEQNPERVQQYGILRNASAGLREAYLQGLKTSQKPRQV